MDSDGGGVVQQNQNKSDKNGNDTELCIKGTGVHSPRLVFWYNLFDKIIERKNNTKQGQNECKNKFGSQPSI